MLKGLWTLLITGVLLNPVVFFGALGGVAVYFALDFEKIQMLAFDYHFYLLFFVLSSLYVYIFRKSYNEEYTKTDWGATFGNMIKHFLLMIFAFVMGILSASYFDFSGLKKAQTPPQVSDFSEYSKLLEMQNQYKEWENNYNDRLTEKK